MAQPAGFLCAAVRRFTRANSKEIMQNLTHGTATGVASMHQHVKVRFGFTQRMTGIGIPSSQHTMSMPLTNELDHFWLGLCSVFGLFNAGVWIGLHVVEGACLLPKQFGGWPSVSARKLQAASAGMRRHQGTAHPALSAVNVRSHTSSIVTLLL